MLLAGVDIGKNPLVKQAFQDDQYNQGVNGVIARAVDKYMRGEDLTPAEKEFVNAQLNVLRKQGYVAPPRSGGGSEGGDGGRNVRTQVGNDGKTYYSADGANWYSTRAEAMAGG
jgi:hypothetical protein